MIGKILDRLYKKGVVEDAEAHCDYPCGIYDPYIMQYCAHTVVRMVDLINSMEVPKEGGEEFVEYVHNMTRAVQIKEEYAEKCKHEIRILWGDYFKQEHLKSFPELHQLVFDALHLASKAKQTSSKENAVALLEATWKIAEIFWKSKNIESVKVDAPYPTKMKIVVPKF
ncbi:MAG: superoxide dismutase, Ni [Candidatus Micrarchaeaceae archaeon]